jgi:hypothetical protein
MDSRPSLKTNEFRRRFISFRDLCRPLSRACFSTHAAPTGQPGRTLAARIPEQRSGPNVARWLFRLVIGAMWWQQTLWKLPPYYTDKPDEPFGTTGLASWMKILGQHASIPLQADFVNHSFCRISFCSRPSFTWPSS